MVAISCQAPNWTLMRLQPPEHQLYFAKAIVLHLGAPTPKDSNPFSSEAPTLTWYKLFCCSSLLPSLLRFCFTHVLLILLPLLPLLPLIELRLPLDLIICTPTPFLVFPILCIPDASDYSFPLPSFLVSLPLFF